MKKKDLNELKTKTLVELKKMCKEARIALVKARMEINTGKIKNVSIMGKKRDEIAKMLTIMAEKQELENK
jgi:ribosomal protein L29